MAALAILEAIVGAAEVATNIVSGVLSNKETERANKENLRLAELAREDKLKQENIQNRFTNKNLGLRSKALRFQMDEAEKDRGERMEEKGYNRMQRAANKFAEYLNFNNAYQGSKLSTILSR
jgi:hypothetical protein